jgi:uncharacterized protein
MLKERFRGPNCRPPFRSTLPMSITDYMVLTVPGYTNSGPSHWQTLWERADPAHFRRVDQRDWDNPDPRDWVETLLTAIRSAREARILLVGHSLGAVAIAQAASQIDDGRVGGALLVAPCDVEQPDTPAPLRPFAPMPSHALPWRSILVASSDDPYLSLDSARRLARLWNARLEILDDAGHINTASGHGPFPMGERLLGELLRG